MNPVIESCRRGFLEPDCSRAGAVFAYGLMTVVNIIVLFLPYRPQYIRMGTLPLSFFIAASSMALSAGISFSLIFYIFYIHAYSPLVFGYVIIRTSFWIVCLTLFIRKRDLQFLSTSLAFSFCGAALIQLVPVFNWNVFFDEKSWHNGEIVIYFIEGVLTSSILLCTLVFSTIRSESPSSWTGFSRKMSLILPYVWPRKSVSLQLRVALCVILLIFGRVINVTLPLYSKWIVDALAGHDSFTYNLIVIATVLKFLQGNGAMGGFLNTVRTYLWIPIQQYTTRELEVELFAHLHSLSLRWHLSRKTGLVLRVMDRGTSSVNNILNYVLFNIIPTIADIAIAVVFFFSTFNAYFGVIVFITMVLYLAVTIMVTEWRTKFQRKMNEKDNASSAIGTDSLLNYETVKYYGNEDFEVERFRRSIEEYQFAEWQSQASLAILNMSQNGIIGIGMMAGSLLVAYLITTDNSLTVGDYVMFTSYILQLYAPLNFFGTVYRVIQKSFIDMENMFDLMGEEVEVQDSPYAIEYHPTEGRISVKNLRFSYVAERNVLNNVSFDVASGETIALVGPSGSGKSTIVRLLFRLFESNENSINFDGKDVKSLKIKSLRKQIGIVPQDTVLFNDTIMYNIRFGNTSATDEDVVEAAKSAMIHEKIISLPQGYETLVGERGLKLSGGEKQRVAIARTLLKKPQFIFLDEATSALDTHTERAIQRCLEELCSTRTSVVVAHRLSTVVNADKILVLDKGTVVETGSHSELMSKRGVYYTMWQSQSTESSSSTSSSNNSTEQNQ